jgi:6-phosphogluconolactonase
VAEIRVVDDPAGEVAALLDATDGHVVLAGGSSPRRAYERCDGDWSRKTVWFGDERCVGPEHEWSNYRMARGALLHRVEPAGAHRIEGELGAREASDRYDALIRERVGEAPAFDLVLLGLGPDAHVASLFPGKPALEERERRAVGVPEAGMEPYVPRVTLTLPVLNAARQLVLLITGAEKAAAVSQAFGSRARPDPAVPASMLRDPVVYLDAAAAERVR